jgi:hypothetical protein
MTATKLILPLAMALGAAACSDNGDLTGPDAAVSVRFVNAIADAPGSLLLTANGTAVGSPLAFGSQAATCTTVPAGNTVLTLTAAATGTDGVARPSLTTQSVALAAGGNYTVIAMGNAADPQFLVLRNDSFDGNVGSTETAVRFANLMSSGERTFNIFTGSNLFGDPTYANVTFGFWTTYTKMAAGPQTYIFTNSDAQEIFRTTSGQVSLQARGIYTIAVMPTASGGFHLLPIAGC